MGPTKGNKSGGIFSSVKNSLAVCPGDPPASGDMEDHFLMTVLIVLIMNKLCLVPSNYFLLMVNFLLLDDDVGTQRVEDCGDDTFL